MEKIKVLVVEDKALIAEDIAMRLKKHAMEIVGICSSGEEAIELLQTKKPDLILMDIQLAGKMDGIATAETILQNHDVSIIYLSDSADPKTLERAKRTLPASYLTKPFNEPDLVRAIDLAFSNANERRKLNRQPVSESIFLRTDNQVFIKLHTDDILYLEADRAYSTLVTISKKFKQATSMNHIHEQLNSNDFIRVHRSHIINVNRITGLEGNMIKLGAYKIQMGKEYRENLMNVLKIVK
ncbi:MAG: response regulator [Cyclobacteriaceae bacterium]|nr:response regulator [Cyclobacteriaceae bacterium]